MVMGLQAVGNRVYKDGRPFRHIGVNHFSLFMRELVPFAGEVNPGLEVDCARMAARGIKVVRVGFGWYGHQTWNNNYRLSQPLYWATVQRVLDAIAAQGMVCIVNMGWSLQGFTQLTYYTTGATIGPSKLADVTSPLYTLWRDYITEFVTRFRDHPGVGAWQFGNEASGKLGNEWHPSWAVDGSYSAAVTLGTKPEGGSYATGDQMSYAGYQRWTRQLVDLIHSLDPHGRMVLSGDAVGNAFAVAQRRTANLGSDAKADWDGRPDTGGIPWLAYRESAFDGICNHVYPLAAKTGDGQFFADGDRTYRQHIQYCAEWCAQVGKPMILEEFGATYRGSGVDPVSTNLATESANFNEALTAIVDFDVPLACVWNWGGTNITTGIEWQLWDVTDPSRTYQLDAIQAVNATRT